MQDLALLKELREFARTDYSFYLEYVHNAEYKPGAHHLLICDKLQQIIDGKLKRLMIFMPARHGKSMTITESFPSYFLGRFPHKRIITVAYGADLARRFGRKNRQKVEEYGEELFNIRLAPDNSSVQDWSIDGHEGGLLSVGIGGSVTGHGANLLILDDLLKNREEASSPRMRDKIFDEYQSTLNTRLTSDGAVILIMTRWHEDDIGGRLLAQDGRIEEGGAWDVLSLAAEAEEDDILGRQVGEPLWPQGGFNSEWLQRKKQEIGTLAFNSIYQQRPSAQEGNIIKRQWIKYYNRLPEKFDDMLISLDASFKNTQTADYCVIGVWGKIGADKYLLDFIRAKMNFVETVRAMRSMSAKWPNVITKLVEDKANGSAIIDYLRQEITGIIPINPRESKEARLSAVSPEFESGNIYFPSPQLNRSISECIEELVNFPNAANDDFADMTSQALKRWQEPRGLFIGRV